MQLPGVNLNGTSAKALFEMNLAAVNALRAAIDALAKAAPHGRDYQTLDDGAAQRAITEHWDRMKRLQGVMTELEGITVFLYSQ